MAQENTAQSSRVRYAHLGTVPGAGLLLSEDPLTAIKNLAEWERGTGMKQEQLVTPRLASYPIPVYLRDDLVDTPRRFSDVHPRALWHPLFWLPRYLGAPYIFEDIQGQVTRRETFDEWSVRLSIVLETSSLYNEKAGGWLDVLYFSGLDVANVSDVERIAAWQRGEADEILDNIDLSGYLAANTEEAYIQASHDDTPTILGAHWDVVASAFISHLSDTGAHLSAELVRERLVLIARLALIAFSDEDFIPPSSVAHPDGFWNSIISDAGSLSLDSVERIQEGPWQSALDWLSSVSTHYRRHTVEAISLITGERLDWQVDEGEGVSGDGAGDPGQGVPSILGSSPDPWPGSASTSPAAESGGGGGGGSYQAARAAEEKAREQALLNDEFAPRKRRPGSS